MVGTQDFDIEIFKAQSRGDTVVGHDVWIGRNATILPGVTIGSGAIIASQQHRESVAMFPAYGIVAGNPAKAGAKAASMHQRTIDRLHGNRSWWNWPVALINSLSHPHSGRGHRRIWNRSPIPRHLKNLG